MAFKFDSNNYDTSSVGQFECVPEGIYKCKVEKCSLQPGQVTQGSSNVKVTYSVLEGDHKGKKIFQNIVYENPSKQAEEIGHRMLALLCKCCYKPVLNQGVEELQGSDVFLDVKVSKYKDKDTNNVFKIYALDPITSEMIDVNNGDAPKKDPNLPPAGFGVQTSK